jgi:hypothetical protein
VVLEGGKARIGWISYNVHYQRTEWKAIYLNQPTITWNLKLKVCLNSKIMGLSLIAISLFHASGFHLSETAFVITALSLSGAFCMTHNVH